MLQTFLEDGSTLPEEVHRIIRGQLGQKVAMVLSEYNGHMSNLLVKVVSRNPGLLEQKLIVSHFVKVTYIGLPRSCSMLIPFSRALSKGTRLQTKAGLCDLASFGIARYEIRNDSTHKVEFNQGIIWFLNLCASYQKHMRENLGNERITFIEPYSVSTIYVRHCYNSKKVLLHIFLTSPFIYISNSV
jgi:hypothetical protein